MITVVGEALIDLVGSVAGGFRSLPGGAPANVAVGLARLGSPVSLLSRMGRDVFGRQLRAHLEANAVDLRDAVDVPAPTTLAVATLDPDGNAAYDFYTEGTTSFGWRPDELPARLRPDVSTLVTGSLALAVGPGAAAVEALLRREHERGEVTTVVDPNIRPALGASPQAERDRVERQLRHAHVVKSSAEDVAWLYPDASPAQVAERWRALGPALVVVTLGADGAYARVADGEVTVSPPRAGRVVDTVGAGDAFCAGLVDAMRRRDLLGGVRVADVPAATVGELLDAAARVATLTCERAGADPPTAEEVAAALAGLRPK